MTPERRRILMIGVPVLAVVLVAAFVWFRPDALFTDRVVDEELDDAVAAALEASTPPPEDSTASPTPTPDPTTAPAPDQTTRPAPPSPTVPVTPTTPLPTTDPGPTIAPATPDMPPAGPMVVARGDWISLEHDTSGSIAVIDDNGDLELAFVDLDTSNGPDLRVILSPKKGVAGDWYGYEVGATYLGPLKGNQGTQTYDLPDGLDLDDFASVVIWCERFTVGFGVADLVA